RRDQANLLALAVADLLIADVGQQPIADALSAHGIFHLAALGDKEANRLGGATIADTTLRCPVRLPQEAKIADARPVGEDLRVRAGALQLRNLEGKTRGRGQRIGEDVRL